MNAWAFVCATIDEALEEFLQLRGLEELVRLGKSDDVRILESALMALVVLAEDGIARAVDAGRVVGRVPDGECGCRCTAERLRRPLYLRGCVAYAEGLVSTASSTPPVRRAAAKLVAMTLTDGV
jgi:hypothetical protein